MTADEKEKRDKALAQLAGTPAWDALKDLMSLDLRHVRIDFTDPQWAAKMAYHNGRTDRVLDLIKQVESAGERTKASQRVQP